MRNKNFHRFYERIEENPPFKENLVIWIGLRASDNSLIRFMKPEMVISTHHSKDCSFMEERLPVFSSEKDVKMRTDSNLSDLDPYLGEIVSFLSSFKEVSSYLVCYHSTPGLEHMVKRHPNIKILNPPAKLKVFLDRKSIVRKELKKRGVRTIPGLEARLSPEVFAYAIQECGLPLVVQFDNSASGNGSYLIEKDTEFHELCMQYPQRLATIMKHIDGKSLNINAVRTRNFVVVSEPSLQIIGQQECTSRRFGYCGNDFNIGSKLSDEQVSDSMNITQTVGNWLGDLEYYGIFGVDLLADSDHVYFVELNPRFQGSTALLTDRQIEMGKIPLSLFHIVPYLDGIAVEPSFIAEYNRFRVPLNVSQILLHNISGRDQQVIRSVTPGRYSIENDFLHYLGPARFLSETRSYDELLIQETPEAGTTLLKESDEICRISTYKDVLAPNGKDLNEYGRELVRKVSTSFQLR